MNPSEKLSLLLGRNFESVRFIEAKFGKATHRSQAVSTVQLTSLDFMLQGPFKISLAIFFWLPTWCNKKTPKEQKKNYFLQFLVIVPLFIVRFVKHFDWFIVANL